MKHSSAKVFGFVATLVVATVAEAQENPPATPAGTPPSTPAPAAPAGTTPPETPPTAPAAPSAPSAEPPATSVVPPETPAPDAAPTAPATAPPTPATAPPAAAPPPPTAPVAVEAPLAAATPRKPVRPAREPERPLLGLALGTPDTSSIVGRIRPSFGVRPVSASDWRFDFHGFLNVPFRLGLNQRENPLDTQYQTVWHGPPVVPDELERFEHTGNIPEPWVQIGFSYGNSDVVANVIIAARSVSNASGFFNPPSQLGINDAFLTFKRRFGNADVEFDVGAFAARYGAMGEYDSGRYDTPVIARIAGVGEVARATVPLSSELSFLAEHGFMGQWDRVPLGVEPAGWNGFADPNVGTSFAHHAHLGLAAPDVGQFGVHYANAWTRDDRTAPRQPDGAITVLGADVEGHFAPFGRAYLGFSWTDADRARSVAPVIRVLNAPGGPGLMREYLGPDSGGTGRLTTLGAQYDVSIGELVRDPLPFSGYGPDVVVSVFGVFTHVTSDDETTALRLPDGQLALNQLGGKPLYDGVDKLKYGAEVTYAALAWLAGSVRYDRVIADTGDDAKTFAVLSPRVIFRSDYNSQDQVTLQYSRWMYGSGVTVRTGYEPRDAPWVEPDEDTFSLTATMWW